MLRAGCTRIPVYCTKRTTPVQLLCLKQWNTMIWYEYNYLVTLTRLFIDPLYQMMPLSQPHLRVRQIPCAKQVYILHEWMGYDKAIYRQEQYLSKCFQQRHNINLREAKEKYRVMFEIQKSGDKTSSGEIGLDIRTHASPKVGQDQVSRGVSVLCWHVVLVAYVLWKPCTIR